MTDIFHEIEEDLRRDRLRKLWDRFGGFIIALVLLVVAGTAGWSGYKYWRQQQAIAASAEFEKASALIRDGKFGEAEAAFAALAQDGPSGYHVIARFAAAGAAAQKNKADGIAAFDTIASDSAVPAVPRDMARIRAGLLMVDSASLDEVRQKVGAIATGTGPLRNAAREIVALAELKAGDAAAANKTATEITEDAGSTAGERSRAELIRRLTASAAAPAAPAAESPAATQ